MTACDRRAFLTSLGSAAGVAVAGAWLPSMGYAQAGRGPARAFLRRSPGRGRPRSARARFVPRTPGPRHLHGRLRARVSPRRCEGIPHRRRPGSQRPRRARSFAIRAGNFVSGYNWLDGVGPKAQRPVVLDRAWNSLETNQFGTNEFLEWCGMVGTEPLLGLNFGTGTVEMAVAYVEVLQPRRAARGGASSDDRTGTIGRTTCATGASATRWTGPGRSASCRRASTGARRATPPSRCG